VWAGQGSEVGSGTWRAVCGNLAYRAQEPELISHSRMVRSNDAVAT
jgi:hypothetical protein